MEDEENMKTTLGMVGLVLGLAVIACGGRGSEPKSAGDETVVVAGRPIDKDAAKAIKNGEANKASIEKTFGTPFKEQRIEAPAECNEGFQYRYTTRNGKKIHVAILLVVFDPSGVVCGSHYHEKEAMAE
jgi:hypothetical protein